MDCPKCKDVSLKKKDYDSPYNCNICGGIWVEFDKVPAFFDTMSNVESKEIAGNLNDDKTGFCPLGHGLMTRAKVESNDDPFYLEKCSSCGGIWFDNDEWRRVINNKLEENLNDIWCSSWQTQQRKKKSRTNYLEINKKILGMEVFERVLELSEILKDHPEKGRAMALLHQEIEQNH
jgi:Zn-finger nucleic acid-binding protein